MKPRRCSQRGLTLLELLIAVTLLSLLSIGMFLAMRIGLSAFTKADDRLMMNRRAAGAQHILQEELESLMPVRAPCGAGRIPGGFAAVQYAFFQGQADTMHLVSTFSLQQGSRGKPQILEMFVIPGERSGVRLVVNEVPYAGPAGAGALCTPNPTGGPPLFPPVSAGPKSFVLADQLAYCRFWYLTPPAQPGQLPAWKPSWTLLSWPLGVRVEMAPLGANPAEVQPITVTAPIRVTRSPQIPYGDF